MKLAIIGGTGAALFPGQQDAGQLECNGRWGEPSSALKVWSMAGHQVAFLARHGDAGVIPPHCVNYQANIQALRDWGADAVVALNAVGGISPDAEPGRLVIPDQLIDYTWGRKHTYYDGSRPTLDFIDLSIPYNENIREGLVSAGASLELGLLTTATYAVTQGPRLETPAEIDRLERDGNHIVGMTSMPEAALAREIGLPYASCCNVVNWAAGRSDIDIHAEIQSYLQSGMERSAALIEAFLTRL